MSQDRILFLFFSFSRRVRVGGVTFSAHSQGKGCVSSMSPAMLYTAGVATTLHIAKCDVMRHCVRSRAMLCIKPPGVFLRRSGRTGEKVVSHFGFQNQAVSFGMPPNMVSGFPSTQEREHLTTSSNRSPLWRTWAGTHGH